MVKKPYNLKEAAAVLGIGYSTLRANRKKWGIGVSVYGSKNKKVLPEELAAFQKRRSEKNFILV